MLKKGIALLTGILIVYVALVSTHKGEFWPFSIYPMFSQGGQPWTHTLVRSIPVTGGISWNNKPRRKLPGKPVALGKTNIDLSSLSAYLVEDKAQNHKQIQSYLKSKLNRNSLLIFKVQGRIISGSGGSATVTYTPLLLVRKDTVIFNPRTLGSSTKQSDS